MKTERNCVIVRCENILNNLIVLLTFVFVVDVIIVFCKTNNNKKRFENWNRKPIAEYLDGSHTNVYRTKYIQAWNPKIRY